MTTDQSAPRSLSSDLESLRTHPQNRSLSLAELKQALKERGPAMLLVLLALPFCFIVIPGLSMPFGIAICVIGASLIIGHQPWLPRFIFRQLCFRYCRAIAIPGRSPGADLARISRHRSQFQEHL
jgi:hypothetical protein